jgi:hypothetical protein
LLPDLSELAPRDAGAVAVPDGASSDAPAPDASTLDAPLPDTGPLPDGATCTATFCDDFERTSAKGAWDLEQAALGGVLGIDKSGRSALQFSFSGQSGAGQTALAYLSKGGFKGKKTHVEFDFAADLPLNGNYNSVNVAMLGASGRTFFAAFQLNVGQYLSVITQVFDKTQEYSFGGKPLPGTYPAKTWTHASLDTSLDGVNGTASITVQGMGTVSFSAAFPDATADVRLEAGCAFSNFVNGSGNIRIDDYRATITP